MNLIFYALIFVGILGIFYWHSAWEGIKWFIACIGIGCLVVVAYELHEMNKLNRAGAVMEARIKNLEMDLRKNDENDRIRTVYIYKLEKDIEAIDSKFIRRR